MSKINLRKLKNKYRLIIYNDKNFEEVFSFRLSRLNVFTYTGVFVILISIILVLLISVTPLKYYIPGFSDTNIRKKIYKSAIKIEKLETKLSDDKLYIESIKKILLDKDLLDKVKNNTLDSSKISRTKLSLLDFTISKEDSLLRQEVESLDKFNINLEEKDVKKITLNNLQMFTPLKGVVIKKYKPKEKQYGIDISSTSDAVVSVILEGRVIFADWSLKTGYTIHVQHSNNLISVYQHNSRLLKKIGNFVHTGDAIAIVGNTGEKTEDTRLHFQLWHGGKTINPEDYIAF